MKRFSASTIFMLALLPSSEGVTILEFEGAPIPSGTRAETELFESGFELSGRFGHQGSQASDRASNGSDMLTVIFTERVIVTSVSGLNFDAISIDLGEYSPLFIVPTEIEFIGRPAGGSEVVTVFVTDGVYDEAGGEEDLQTFQFPSTFRDLTSLRTKLLVIDVDMPFAFDNLRLRTVPEPTSIALISLSSALALARRRKPRRR